MNLFLLSILSFCVGVSAFKPFAVVKEYEACDQWARDDNQCIINPRFMWGHCFSSCAEFAKDDSPLCTQWAMEGECGNNRKYVAIHCPESCGFDIAWSQRTREELSIDPISVNSSTLIKCKTSFDVFSAAEIMRARLHLFLGGGGYMTESFAESNPSEYLSVLGIAEVFLYALRLYNVCFKVALDLGIHNADVLRNGLLDNRDYIQLIAETLSSGYSYDLLSTELVSWLSFVDSSSLAVAAFLHK
jgi:hypothetical protein